MVSPLPAPQNATGRSAQQIHQRRLSLRNPFLRDQLASAPSARICLGTLTLDPRASHWTPQANKQVKSAAEEASRKLAALRS